MEQKWHQISRRRRGKRRRGSINASKGVSNVDEEVVNPVPEVSTAKQLQIIERVRDIIKVLQDSTLIKDTLGVIVKHFDLTARKTSAEEEKTERGGESDQMNNDDPLTLIGYGLGSFCASSNATHQLGFLVALKQALDKTCYLTEDAMASWMSEKNQHDVEIFDPAMNKSDAVIAEHFELKVIQENEHARRQVVFNTAFFMPHCGKALYQNVLACNWGPAMKKLIIIGNSFSAYADRVLAAEERKQLLLVSLLPYLEEVRLPCGVSNIHEDFARYEAAFNDLSVHRFPSELLDGAFDTETDLIARMAAGATLID